MKSCVVDFRVQFLLATIEVVRFLKANTISYVSLSLTHHNPNVILTLVNPYVTLTPAYPDINIALILANRNRNVTLTPANPNVTLTLDNPEPILALFLVHHNPNVTKTLANLYVTLTSGNPNHSLIIMKSLDPLRAKKIFIRNNLGHTPVSAIKA